MDGTVDMAGGDGTLVINGEASLLGADLGARLHRHGRLVVAGTTDAPTLKATKTDVHVDSDIPGLTDDLFSGLFTTNEEVPIEAGAPQC